MNESEISVVVPAVRIVKEKLGLCKAAVASCRSLRMLVTFKSERSNVSTQ